MKNKFITALNELGVNYDKLEINDFILSDHTILENHILYYKDMPSGLSYVSHLVEFNEAIKDHQFNVVGTMIDLSRNAVFKVDYFKHVIRKQASLGYNEIWLYMEDVYELTNYPKFGYLRGRYSKEELIELVSYANLFGISLIPCIQTLGHMGQFLRWFSNTKLKDQPDILLPENDSVFELIKEMLSTMKYIFKSNKIHIGMDETFGHGLGRYYKLNGFKNPKQIFLDHLKKVNDLCLKEGFEEVCVWSDMFFRTASQTDSYYDPTIKFPIELLNQIPKNITLVYWDYYNSDISLVKKMLENHISMDRKVIMASGTWLWTKLNYDKNKTDATAPVHIKAALDLGIKDIILTQWNDDGAYCDYETNYLGLFDMMNVMKSNTLNTDYLSRINLISYENLVLASNINALGFSPVHALWDDILLGIYANQFVGYEYQLLDPVIDALKSYVLGLENRGLENTEYLARLLKAKLSFRRHFIRAYKEKTSFNQALEALNEIDLYIPLVNKSLTKHWHERNKVFGLEVLQNRIYAQLSRTIEARYIINAYANQMIDRIDFLEEVIVKEPYLPVKYIDVALSSKQ